MNNQTHWDKVFAQKSDGEKSWFEPYPVSSIAFIDELHLAKDAAIIDVGGGDSRLVDALLEKGYTDITVLDISAAGIKKAKDRLGEKAKQIHWIVSDILDFTPSRHYDCWHDRAVFHFVTQADNIQHYTELMANTIVSHGALIIGTFAGDGPEKCSGLPVRRYSQANLINLLQPSFEKIKCIEAKHQTPFNTIQSFTFCSFRRA